MSTPRRGLAPLRAGFTPSHPEGFTLIELLVVMAIIAILIALLMPIYGRARTAAKYKTAKADVNQLAMAWNAYLLDYRVWQGAGWRTPTDNKVNATLVQILSGGNPSSANPRRIAYMDFNTRSTNSLGEFIDPWNVSYRVVFDESYMNNVTVPGHGSVPRNIAVWSKGDNNGRDVQHPDDPSDDVMSWEQ